MPVARSAPPRHKPRRTTVPEQVVRPISQKQLRLYLGHVAYDLWWRSLCRRSPRTNRFDDGLAFLAGAPLAGRQGARYTRRQARRAATKLVEVGLWQETDDWVRHGTEGRLKPWVARVRVARGDVLAGGRAVIPSLSFQAIVRLRRPGRPKRGSCPKYQVVVPTCGLPFTSSAARVVPRITNDDRSVFVPEEDGPNNAIWGHIRSGIGKIGSPILSLRESLSDASAASADAGENPGGGAEPSAAQLGGGGGEPPDLGSRHREPGRIPEAPWDDQALRTPETPPPPQVKPSMTDDQCVAVLAKVYREACRVLSGERCWTFARGVKNGQARAKLVAAARALQDEGLPPVYWVRHAWRLWKFGAAKDAGGAAKAGRRRGKTPPWTVVWNAARIRAEAAAAGNAERAKFAREMRWLPLRGDLQLRWQDLYAAWRRAVRSGTVDPGLAARLTAQHFPGGYDAAHDAAAAECEAAQGEIDQRVAAWEWVWNRNGSAADDLGSRGPARVAAPEVEDDDEDEDGDEDEVRALLGGRR